MLFSLCILLTFSVVGQKPAAKASAWKKGGSLTIMGAQTGSRNWAPANEKFSITGVGSLFLWANKTKGKKSWENTAELNYGIANTESAGPRKVEDKIDLFSRYNYYFKSKIGAGLTGSFRTQFSNGFDYNAEPKKRISGFFAPAYLLLSPGIHLKPVTDLTVSVGPALRWIFVSNSPYSYNYQGGIKPNGSKEKSIAEIYGVHPDRESRMEAGLFIGASFNRKQFFKNIDYRSRLEAIADLLSKDVEGVYGQVLASRQPGNVDVYWTNTVTMHVNNWIRVNYCFDVVYDDDVKIFGSRQDRPATQMRSLLGVGLVAAF
jgi:hypothetical protein